MPSETFEGQLQALTLMGGYTAADLWPATNVVGVGWLLLAFFPRWKYTMPLSLLSPLLHSAIYVLAIFSLILFPADPSQSQPDFLTLEGIAEMFRDANVVFVGWVHYLVFDLLIGRMIVQDSIGRGSSLAFHYIAILPCLIFTLYLGPTGWLMYMGLRSIFLSGDSSDKKNKQF